MGAMDVLGAAIGMTEKAIIEIVDERLQYEITEIKNKMQLDMNKKIDAGTASVKDRVKFFDEMDKLSGLSASAGSMFKSYSVRFNPSELSVSARRGDSMTKINLNRNSDRDQTESSEFPRIELRVDLIFDKVNNTDAFINEKLVLNPTAIVANVARLAKGKDNSVQKEVEGFLAAVRNEKTKKARFYWKDFAFEGTITTLGAKYTMFNPDGVPIRGIVQIMMVGLEISGQNEVYVYDLDNVFGKKQSITNTDSKYSSFQQAKNLFNLPI